MDTDATPNIAQPPPEATAGEPKKYIRTFAGDMETLKKGGAPELAPLAEPKTLQATEEKPTPLKTYSSDFSDKMKETKASPVTVLAAEQDAAPHTHPVAPRSSFSTFLYIFAGVILFAASGVGAYFAYMRYAAQLEPIISSPLVSAPIFVDENEQVSGTGAVLVQAIQQSVARPLSSGAVRFLFTANATSTDNSIFSALQLPAPNVLLRNLNASQSMAGVVNIGGNQSPFFLLSVLSYSDTFSGMLAWEPMMPRDLEALFPLYASLVLSTSTMATSTLATTTPIKVATTTTATSSVPAFIAGFRDEVVSNHDARVYRDAEGRSILLYGYWDQATLIIARDPAAFTEILRRIASSHS